MSSNADIKSVLEVPYGVQKTKSSSFSLVAFRSQVFVLHGKENNSRAREIDDTLPLQQIHCFTNASVRFFFLAIGSQEISCLGTVECVHTVIKGKG